MVNIGTFEDPVTVVTFRKVTLELPWREEKRRRLFSSSRSSL